MQEATKSGSMWKLRGLLISLVMLAVTFAGCADSAPIEEVDDAGVDKKVQATSTTGGIRGVVVDESIVPIEGVKVVVQGAEKSVVTDADGTFVFSGLAPGVYFVDAKHPLYDGIQSSVTVEAGVEEPPALRIQMTRNALSEPSLVTLTLDGYISCSTNVVFGYSEECGEGVGYPCDLPDTVYSCGERIGKQPGSSPQLWFKAGDNDPKSIIVEQIWTPSVSVATGNTDEFFTRVAIDWICDPFCGGDSLGSITAASPLYLYVGNETLDTRGITPETDLSTFTYSGANPGILIEQRFEQYVTLTYGLPAPEGWGIAAGSEYPF